MARGMACYDGWLMKGIVLAGGTGSRLFPLTKITNKHLLPIYDRPMIYYPIQTLVDAGIEDIMIVTGGRNSGDFLRLLANGKQFGLKHINYTYQEGEGGIADALALAEHFADGQKICVVLGDNIIEGSIREAADRFRQQPAGAHILLKEVPDAERFGVAEVAGDRIVGHRREAARSPKSNYAVTGIYMYDATVFDKIKTLVPSGRGELEITDVNNAYIREGTMTFSYLDGWWTDAGTFDSLLRAANLVAQSVADKGRRELVAEGAATSLMAAETAQVRRRARSPPPATWNWPFPSDQKGLGSLILSPDSPELIAGVRVQPFPIFPGRSRLFPRSAAHRPGPGAGFPAGDHADLRRAELSRAPSRHSTFTCTRPIAGRRRRACCRWCWWTCASVRPLSASAIRCTSARCGPGTC